MPSILEIPEVAGLIARPQIVRIAPELDIPITARVRRLIDTPAFRRLAGISQLGLVSLVYPSAVHSRFEHSLGVYRMALLYLQRLAHVEAFAERIEPAAAELFLVAALLHDIGHWPYCHPLEDIRLPDVPTHEQFAERFLAQPEVIQSLESDWGIQPADVLHLLSLPPRGIEEKILQSMLSGPIDIDKMDYLQRDSIHAGVPYGRNFDQSRLIGSLCLNEEEDGIAITEKGKTAAELMVFARYVMFSEVYWHHGVRSATAMLQRAFYAVHQRIDMERLFHLRDAEFVAQLQEAARAEAEAELLDGLFGPVRRLYKRVAEYSHFEDVEVYGAVSRRPFPWLVACGAELAERVSSELNIEIAPHELLIDAPPVEREVEFNIQVYRAKRDVYQRLDDVSPVVHVLARKQFDDYVKRVRIFGHPRIAAAVRELDSLPDLLLEAAKTCDP